MYICGNEWCTTVREPVCGRGGPVTAASVTGTGPNNIDTQFEKISNQIQSKSKTDTYIIGVLVFVVVAIIVYILMTRK